MMEKALNFYLRQQKEKAMKEKNSVVSTQIRLPANMHEYIKQEADRMGIAQNAFLIILLEQGKKLWESDVSHIRKVK